jgi:hypothetical protein
MRGWVGSGGLGQELGPVGVWAPLPFRISRAAWEPAAEGCCVVLVPVIFSPGCCSRAAASAAHCTATVEARKRRVSRETSDITVTSTATRSRRSAPFYHTLIHYLPLLSGLAPHLPHPALSHLHSDRQPLCTHFRTLYPKSRCTRMGHMRVHSFCAQ